MYAAGLWYLVPFVLVLIVAMLGVVVWPIAVPIALLFMAAAIVVYVRSGRETARREPTGRERPSRGKATTANERLRDE